MSAIEPKAVAVFAGARDHYQLPLALHEAGLLQGLVTDMYWPADKKWFSLVKTWLPDHVIQARFCSGLDSDKTRVVSRALASFLLTRAIPGLQLNRTSDRALGQVARTMANRTGSALFSYSYYASAAFRPGPDRPEHRFLFQLHPDPRSVRSILLEELERVPAARSSLMAELELSLPEGLFQELANEPHWANGWVVASSFTAQTLVENGIPRERILVVPYGVDLSQFPARMQSPDQAAPFTVLFVGSMIQRKGLSYLLKAIRLLKTQRIRLLLCGRGHIDRQLLAEYGDLAIEIKTGLPRDQLVRHIHMGDIFALPSLAEGFGHVILENMACGLPVIATEHTCAPDVIHEGQHGFLVPIRSAEALAERLDWGIRHRTELAEMGKAAAVRAREFTWEKFRAGVVDAYRSMVAMV
jgi:glycosyltransferase involved in cell wall biosynthesis